MANLKVISALAISAALAVATPAMAQHAGGGGFHGGGGGGFHGGGGGGMHAGGFGGGFRGGALGGGGVPHAAMGNSGFRGATGFRNAQASMGAAPAGGFASRAPVASGYGRGWNNGGWRHGYRPGIGFAAGLAVGSGLGLGYGYDGYYGDDYAYNAYNNDDSYVYNDGYYDTGSPGYVVSSNDDPASCAQRYRSYDPASGTYLGFDGQRHPCP
jgi:hypothetical protein